MVREERETTPLETHLEIENDLDIFSSQSDERWLISYADMMTLMFGLFVMLYAIAMETQGKPERYFLDLAQDQHVSTLTSTKPPDVVLHLQHQLDVARKDLAQKTDQLEKALAQVKTQEQVLTTLRQSIERPNPTPAASTQSSSDLRIQDLRKQLALKTQSQLAFAETSRVEIENLRMKVSEQERQVQSLQTKIESVTKENLKSFMVIVLKWGSEKHDLDLNVTDPTGHIYSFKKISYRGSEAKFILDSRSGPGVEMWQTPTLIPGNYKIDFIFYNNYGNPGAAQVSGSVITRLGELAIKPFQMSFSRNRRRTFIVHVNTEGQASIQ